MFCIARWLKTRFGDISCFFLLVLVLFITCECYILYFTFYGNLLVFMLLLSLFCLKVKVLSLVKVELLRAKLMIM
jgi:hypothetical protein